jgi:hypothetical protein
MAKAQYRKSSGQCTKYSESGGGGFPDNVTWGVSEDPEIDPAVPLPINVGDIQNPVLGEALIIIVDGGVGAGVDLLRLATQPEIDIFLGAAQSDTTAEFQDWAQAQADELAAGNILTNPKFNKLVIAILDVVTQNPPNLTAAILAYKEAVTRVDAP